MGTVNRYADICTHSSKRRRVTIPIWLSNKPCNDATDCIPTNRVVYPLTLFGPLSVSYIFLLFVLFCFSFLGCSAQAHVIRTHTHTPFFGPCLSRVLLPTHTPFGATQVNGKYVFYVVEWLDVYNQGRSRHHPRTRKCGR